MGFLQEKMNAFRKRRMEEKKLFQETLEKERVKVNAMRKKERMERVKEKAKFAAQPSHVRAKKRLQSGGRKLRDGAKAINKGLTKSRKGLNEAFGQGVIYRETKSQKKRNDLPPLLR